jgi:hypothetical protein
VKGTLAADPDPLIARLQIGAIVWCALGALAAWLVRPDQPAIALGVIGGGVLTVMSFLAIKSSLDALFAIVGSPASAESVPTPDEAEQSSPHPDARRQSRARTGTARAALARLTLRYALLAGLAYVMIARLRVHPIGLVIGASSLVASASFEAARWVWRPR